MGTNALRYPRKIQRELIREHERLMEETRRRLNHERFMRQSPINIIHQQTRQIPTGTPKNLTENIQIPFQPIFPEVMPALKATHSEIILGLRSISTKIDVATQYRRLCMVLRTDRNPVIGASVAMAQVNGAYVELKKLKIW